MSARPKVIGIAVNRAKPEARQCLAALLDLLAEHGVRVLLDRDCPVPRLARRADLVVALGGDGTILRVARELAGAPTPILGINLGRLGFLTGVRCDELGPVMAQVLRGAYTVSERRTLAVAVWRRGRRREVHHALNDAVIARGAVSRIVTLRLSVDGAWVTEYLCDGMILATATGSTAYALSAGGPILLPSTPACVVTPICPHALSNRSIVLSDRSVVRCQVAHAAGELLLTVDGQVQQRLRIGDEVEVRGGPRTVRLVTPAGHEYFEVLRQKLKWSGANV